MKTIYSFLAVGLVMFGCVDSSNFSTPEKNTYSKKPVVEQTAGFSVFKEGCGFGVPDCHYDVYDINGNKVIRINYREIPSPPKIINGTTISNTITFHQFIFFEAKLKAEVKFIFNNEKGMTKFIESNDLFVDGVLSPKAVEDFVFTHGNFFTENYNQVYNR